MEFLTGRIFLWTSFQFLKIRVDNGNADKHFGAHRIVISCLMQPKLQGMLFYPFLLRRQLHKHLVEVVYNVIKQATLNQLVIESSRENVFQLSS